MSCNTCTKARPMIACVDDLEIGLVDANSTYNVYIHNNTTGRTNIYTGVQSDGSGLLVVELTEQPIKDHSYTLWLNKGANGYDEKLPVEIDGNEYLCFDLSFEKINEFSVTSQRIRV